MEADPRLGTVLADLAGARARYWGGASTGDERVEAELAAAWAAVERATERREQVVRLAGAPPCDPGTPLPVVVCDGSNAYLGYHDAAGARRLLTFDHVDSVLFGGSDDAALSGHPLAAQGLEHHEFQEVLNSAWIARREQESSVHPEHRPGWHARLRHFVLTFRDETFECIAARYAVGAGPHVAPGVLAALEG